MFQVTDAVWLDFLRHLRVGDVQQHHLTMLRTLIVGNNGNNGNGAAVDFNSHPWNDAALVTPRHAVRNQWNEQSVHKMAKDRGRRIYICSAEDTYKGRSLNLAERYRLALHLGKRKKNGKKETQIKELPNKIELAVGMKVMVTDNIETDLDLTNGARGEIVGIILDPDEPTIGEGPVVHLQKLPAYILVKLTRTRAGRLEGLDEHVIPIEPAHTTYHVKFSLPDGKITQRTIRRRQFPMTAAYAFTDYRSQGQTIPFVLVDIGTPPTGTLSLFNLYVALSRSSGRESIRLLRDFDDALFLKGHDPVLLAEDDRLESLNESTKMWWQEMRTRMGLVESNTMDCVVDEP